MLQSRFETVQRHRYEPNLLAEPQSVFLDPIARPDVAAVVCAFNEAAQIGRVLLVLTTCKWLSRVIVVDDGSWDSTAALVQAQFPTVELIRHPANLGKGRAMETAASASTEEILLFCDADFRGLTHQMIADTLAPVALGVCDMMIAQRSNALYRLPGVQRLAPKLGGLRSVTRPLWNVVPSRYKHRFQIEVALNWFAETGKGYRYGIFPGLAQVVKETKYGIARGFARRLRMCWQVATAALHLALVYSRIAMRDADNSINPLHG